METSPERPAPVRAVSNAIAGWVDRLGLIWVEGQVAQFSRRQGMNTVFLTLRDAVADISLPVTCSRQLFDSLSPPLVEGASILVHAKPSFYANRGTLSLAAREIRMVGLGELLARIERRRQLLAAEGLFAAERKRRLPFLPHTVGLVTAPGSAAERDVVDNTRRRWPQVRIRVRHAAMQGPHCASEVIDGVRRLDADPEVEVIVVARGGGSIEDLLPFSDEGLLRVVAALRTPVISAIGHEPDSPLLDLVADVRASTPTDAASWAVPDVAEEAARVLALRDRARSLVSGRVTHERQSLDALRARPVLATPDTGLVQRQDEVLALRDRSRRTLGHRLDRAGDDLSHHLARVRGLSPLATLRRGYAVVQDTHGHVVTSAEATDVGASVLVRLAAGRFTAQVEDVETEDSDGPAPSPIDTPEKVR